MGWCDDMRPRANDKTARGNVEADGLQGFDLSDQADGIDHHAIAEDSDHMTAQDAGRDQMQFVNLIFEGDGMPGVVTAGVSGDDIGRVGQPVDDAAFAFVAPLRSDYNRDGHSFWP